MLVWFLFCFLCFFPINGHADNGPVIDLGEIDVVGKLDQARDSIQPALGATDYSISSDDSSSNNDVSDEPVESPAEEAVEKPEKETSSYTKKTREELAEIDDPDI